MPSPNDTKRIIAQNLLAIEHENTLLEHYIKEVAVTSHRVVRKAVQQGRAIEQIAADQTVVSYLVQQLKITLGLMDEYRDFYTSMLGTEYEDDFDQLLWQFVASWLDWLQEGAQTPDLFDYIFEVLPDLVPHLRDLLHQAVVAFVQQVSVTGGGNDA